MIEAAVRDALAPEDMARAHHYALVSRLFFGPPERELAPYLVDPDGGGSETPLARARRTLRLACESAELAVVRAEYEDLFVGVGKSPVTLYTSYYAAARTPDRHLLALRQALEALGLGRAEKVAETEDHISGVCDVMRWLIASRRDIAEQQRFFERFVAPAGPALCDAVAQAPGASFYQLVATFAGFFFDLERDAFGMVD